jgi:hypothetical protein
MASVFPMCCRPLRIYSKSLQSFVECSHINPSTDSTNPRNGRSSSVIKKGVFQGQNIAHLPTCSACLCALLFAFHDYPSVALFACPLARPSVRSSTRLFVVPVCFVRSLARLYVCLSAYQFVCSSTSLLIRSFS